MHKTFLFSILLTFLLGGCITNNYVCTCGEGCKCYSTPSVKDGDPIVSPDKIDNTNQEDNAPQYPNIKPWYKTN